MRINRAAFRVRPLQPLMVVVLLAVFPPTISNSLYATPLAAGIDPSRIERLIAESGAERVAVAFYDLETRERFLIMPDENFHAASTMKVPVMMEVFRQARARKFSLDDRIQIKNDFVSIVDGSHYSLSPENDSEVDLYKRIGQTETIRGLLGLMIDISSNLATNLLIERVTAVRVMEFMREIGARRIIVLRGVEDSQAFQKGLNNTATARDLMIILRRIAERRAVSPAASEEMIQVMLRQRFNEGIPAGLPAGVKVAHKTGSITRVNHDAAIVFPPGRKPYVLVVLTRGISDESRAHKLIADISQDIHRSVERKN